MMNRISFAFTCLCALLLLSGCGKTETAKQPAVDSAPPMSAGMMPSPNASANGGSAQQMEATKEEKVGEVSMKELCSVSGLSVLPGSESSKGDTFKRSDGGSKHSIQFDTKLSLKDIADFYKKDGLDGKVEGDKMSSMGVTNKDSQVIVTATKQPTGEVIVKVTSLIYPKK